MFYIPTKIPSLFCLICSILAYSAVAESLVSAQVTSDETLSTKVNSSNNLDFTITSGNQLGENLFHSFQKFSVPEGGSASFANDLDIQNIFSRVTGNSISEINGLIQTNGSANLFLLNPNGIIFGRNAQLDIGGSFVASTANQINFADGGIFSASDRQTEPLLTVNIPIGLQFGENPGDIINRSIANDGFGLEVLSDKTLAMVGGNLFLEGGALTTIGGRIELGSVDALAFVNLSAIDAGWKLDYQSVQKFQDIQLSKAAIVMAELLDKGSGEILLQGRYIELSGDSGIFTLNESKTPIRNIILKASKSIEITENSDLFTRSFSNGITANIIIDTKRLIVRDDGSFIDTLNESNVKGGNLDINAAELVEIDARGGFNGLTTQTLTTGDAGTLKITTGKLILRDGGQLSSSTFGGGDGGEIIIDARESIDIKGRGISDNLLDDTPITQSGILAQTQTKEAKGDGGDISINTGNLSIREGGTISVAATEGSTGRAGNLEIDANSLSLDRGSITAETAQTGGEAGANINLEISDLLIMENESQISATASGLADGGNIDIDAGFVIAVPNQNNDIIARAAQGIGGNIDLTTNALFGIEERSSTPPNNTNDIDPSSQFGLDGTVEINELEVNPAEALEGLPTEVIDVTGLIAQSLCQQEDESEFIVTGKGGIAPSPNQPREWEVSEVDLVEPASFSEDGEDREDGTGEWSFARTQEKIVEAQGWIVNDRGNVELVAHKTSLNGSGPQPEATNLCSSK